MFNFIARKFDSLSSDVQYILIMSLLVAAVLAGAFGFTAIKSYNEAKAFNRLSNGPQVTTWDAVWLDLRVEACK